VIECFEHIGDVLKPGARYYTTFKPERFNDSLVMSSLLPTTYYYTFDELASIAADADLEIELEDSYPHPNQDMVSVWVPRESA